MILLFIDNKQDKYSYEDTSVRTSLGFSSSKYLKINVNGVCKSILSFRHRLMTAYTHANGTVPKFLNAAVL